MNACKNRPMWHPKLTPLHGKIDPKSIVEVLLSVFENISWKVEHLEADRARFQRETVEKRTKSARKIRPLAPPKRIPNRCKNLTNFGCFFRSRFRWILKDYCKDNGPKLGPKLKKNRSQHRKAIFWTIIAFL